MKEKLFPPKKRIEIKTDGLIRRIEHENNFRSKNFLEEDFFKDRDDLYLDSPQLTSDLLNLLCFCVLNADQNASGGLVSGPSGCFGGQLKKT